MTPAEFKERFKKAHPPIPEGIDVDFFKFRTFPKERLDELKIDAPSLALMRDVGFPEEAAPFLSFNGNEKTVLQKLTSVFSSLGAEYEKYKILGTNGSGDFICIDESDGSVVYLNHDSNMRRVFINSSLIKFAESLCLMAEAFHSNNANDFIGSLSRLDPPAVYEGTMWPVESAIAMEE